MEFLKKSIFKSWFVGKIWLTSEIRLSKNAATLFDNYFYFQGPVDIEQLQLENANLVANLLEKNTELVEARNEIGSARWKKIDFQTKLRNEQKRELELAKKIE